MAAVERFFAAHPNVRLVGRNARFAHQDVDEILGEAKRVAKEIVG